MASSCTDGDEREEKWMSLVNHIADVHVHEENKIFQECLHDELDRDWLKPGPKTTKLIYLYVYIKVHTLGLPFTHF